MSDLISRQEAIDVLNDGAELLRRVLDETYVVGDERTKYEWGISLIESYISEMDGLPSADAVEIVRCKDCFYHGDFDENGYCVCECTGAGMPMQGFCSDGERKEE